MMPMKKFGIYFDEEALLCLDYTMTAGKCNKSKAIRKALLIAVLAHATGSVEEILARARAKGVLLE